MIRVGFLFCNKLGKIELFQKKFNQIDLNMFFLNNANIIDLITQKQLVEKIYTTAIVLFSIKKTEIFNTICKHNIKQKNQYLKMYIAYYTLYFYKFNKFDKLNPFEKIVTIFFKNSNLTNAFNYVL